MFQFEVEIDRPLQEVYRAFGNPDNLPRWQAGLQRVEQISGRPGEIGSKARQLYLEQGRTIELIETVVSHQPERDFTATIEGQGMFCKRRVEFTDRGGTTGLRVCSNVESRSLAMSVMLPAIKSHLQQRQETDFESFKRMVEAGELR